MNLNALNLPLTATYQPFVAGLEQAAAAVNNLARHVDNLTGGFLGAQLAANAVTGAVNGIAASFQGVADRAVAAAAGFERTQVVFTALTGSVGEARAALGDLAAMAQSSPLSLQTLTGASQRLQTFGFSAREAKTILGSLSNLAVLSPQGMDAGLNQMVQMIDRVRDRMEVTRRDIMTLERSGVPIQQALQRQTGLDAGGLRAALRQGDVTPQTFMDALTNLGQSGRFADLAAQQANTYEGRWMAVSNNLELAYRDLGRVVMDAFDLKGATTQFVGFINQVRDNLEAWRPSLMLVGEVFTTLRDVGVAALSEMLDRLRGMAGPSGNLKDQLRAVRDATLDFVEAGASGFVRVVGEVEKMILRVAALVRQVREASAEFKGGAVSLVSPLYGIYEAVRDRLSGRPGADPFGAEAATAAERARIDRRVAAEQGTVADWVNRLRNAAAPAAAAGPSFPDAALAAGAAGGGLIEAASRRTRLPAEDVRADRIAERVKGPFEKFQEEAGRIASILAAGAIRPDVAAKALLMDLGVAEKAAGLGPVKSPQALIEGSKEAESAILATQKEHAFRDVDPLQRIARLQDDANQKADARAALLKQVVDALKNPAALGIRVKKIP